MTASDKPSIETLAGPAAVAVTLRSWRGPWSRGRILRLPTRHLAFVSTGGAPTSVASVSVDPLQDARCGVTAAGAALRAAIVGPVLAAPGAPLVVALDGTVSARPGSYTSTVRVHLEAAPPMAVPIRIDVATSSAWGIALTLLGLLVVSVMAGLEEQGTVANKLREALHKRSEAQFLVAQHPFPDDRNQVPAMDRSYEAAITALSRPRGAGLIDHRLEDAAAPLAEADAQATALRQAVAGQSLADAVIATAVLPWRSLQPQLAALATTENGAPGAAVRPAASDASGSVATALGAQLDRLLATLQDRLVGNSARWLNSELEAQVTRLRLVAASGDVEQARQQASALQTALHRAAGSLAEAQRLVMGQAAQMAYLLGTVAETERGLADPDLPDAARTDIAAKLAATRSILGDPPNAQDLVAVNRAADGARTALTAATLQLVHERVTVATAAASAETDLGTVETATEAAQADPDRSPASKAAHLRAILIAWRSLIGTSYDPAVRPALLARVDTVAAALEHGDMAAVGTGYQALTQAWAAYGVQRVKDAEAEALQPYCRSYSAQLQRRLGFFDQELRWQAPDTRSTEWDRRRDRLRLALNRVAPGNDCLGALLALDKEESGLAAEIGAAATDTAGVDATVRAQAMAVFGTASPDTPRPLVPGTTAPATGLLVDRPLRITVDNLDRDWGAGTALLVDFGDGTPPWRGSAESIRGDHSPEHAYVRPLTAHLSVLAADGFTPDGTAVGALLGQGTATLLIAPAPDSQARILADRFVSARFGIALLLALVIYSWRFQARDRMFGAHSFDYAEAFALGFAVNAAVGELPAALAKLPLG